MIGRTFQSAVCALAAAILLTGCAAKQKKRIVLLENANLNLTDQLNRMHGDLDSSHLEKQRLDRQLLGAQQENRRLQSELGALAALEVPVEVAPGWTPIPGGAMIAIDDSVLFAPGGAVLRDEARITLDAIASTIQGEYAEKDILVFGHTDDHPIRKSGWADNWQLSTERALAVVRYLQRRSVASGRLVAGGCGEHRPRESNESDVNRASNRRVEIFATEPIK